MVNQHDQKSFYVYMLHFMYSVVFLMVHIKLVIGMNAEHWASLGGRKYQVCCCHFWQRRGLWGHLHLHGQFYELSQHAPPGKKGLPSYESWDWPTQGDVPTVNVFWLLCHCSSLVLPPCYLFIQAKLLHALKCSLFTVLSSSPGSTKIRDCKWVLIHGLIHMHSGFL